MSGGTIGENARLRYRVRAGHTRRGIPVPRTSPLPTNPILAAPAERSADRRISAGFIVEAATGAPGLHPARRTKRRTARTRGPACLTIIQSYQRLALLQPRIIKGAAVERSEPAGSRILRVRKRCPSPIRSTSNAIASTTVRERVGRRGCGDSAYHQRFEGRWGAKPPQRTRRSRGSGRARAAARCLVFAVCAGTPPARVTTITGKQSHRYA